MSKLPIYDAIVVGSGASGGWAAKELTEGGMRVLLLEAGESLRQKEWFCRWQDLTRKLKYRGRVDQRTLSLARQPIQSKCHAWDWHFAYYIDDLDNPYLVPEDKPFTWIRSRQEGGRMVVPGHGRQLYRMSDLDFKAASRDGFGDDWPIGHADLDPYYQRVERWIGIHGSTEHLPQLPDSLFLPALPMSAAEAHLKATIEGRWSERRVVSGRTGLPPRTLRSAQATGRLTLRTNAIASHVTVDPGSGKARGIAYIDRFSHKSYEALGRVIVLCASTIETTRLLLNSASDQHPTGLGNSSGLLGHYLHDHFNAVTVTGHIPEAKAEGALPPGGVYIPQFRNLQSQHPDFLRGYGIQAFAERQPQAHFFQMKAFGEMLPRFENRVRVDSERRDAWGIPVARIECAYSDNERRMATDQLEALKEMAEAAGFEIESEQPDLAPPGTAVHEVGTARMGNSPRTSVLNKFNQSWDVKNLFVTDGACFVSQGCQNPTLTIMAMTVRACDYILDHCRKGNL
ncbi:GMC oxidoreductase [Gloeobacter kilaueensis]|uniref:Glucose-methanol-choline oxidoreductase n=1 Tax=Gloeobacter kilaueensis (strain ATCC BAA-2537 / CCAP 1431/1 / ULC 316 / JS1) TaxID=1183438 RepID=U5QLZ1_GLOK1|nr:GMC family oxidoreductase [Gloeobacter kilaueensis]AGY58634.1 glucose-methanol-choline oxidoreductase [Gloeobacter kilaueensis JS1]